jgi:ABC-type bacteriocin/lantibiotic exporter with double-glycine peptidase domain
MAAAYKIIPGVVKIINASGQMKAHEFSLSDIGQIYVEETTEQKLIDTELQKVELKNLGFQYGQQRILNDLSLSIKKGDFIGITGRSGKGKTTILNLMLGFLTPAKGEILINDRSISADEIKDYWAHISYVRQQPFLIHDTIRKNITFEEIVHDEKKLHCVIKISGLNDLVNESSEGLDKMITENGKNISGGQQQRITIARALYKKASLILLDEPFNELDEASAILLVQHFKEMALQGKMIIMITHDSKCLSYCNKIISLDE